MTLYLNHQINSSLIPLIFLILGIFSISAKALSIEDFAKNYQYKQAVISPNGKRVAVTYDNGESTRIYFFALPSLKQLGNHGLGANVPGEIFWVNNDRIVVKVLHNLVQYEEPKYLGELYAVDYDGDNGKFIFGFRAHDPGKRHSRRKANENKAWAEIIDVLKDDDDHILISSAEWDNRGAYPEVMTLDVYRGKTHRIAKSPARRAAFYTDENGKLKLAHSIDSERNQTLFVKKEDGGWKEIDKVSMGESFSIASVVGESFYAFNNAGGDTLGLFKYQLSDGKRRLIYQDPELDLVREGVFSKNTREVIALKTYPDYPVYQLIYPDSKETQNFKFLAKTFLGYSISITSQSQNGEQWIVSVSGDTTPGTFVLFNTKTQEIRPILSMAKHLSPSELNVVEPFKFKSSDGLNIRGYITYPQKPKNEKVPMVVLVHGGPHGVRDIWGYNAEVQMLANQGFAVLQVNYRGSGGYGLSFKKAGYQNWGTLIQRDIYEAANWAIQQGRINKNQICIMGQSFGGYSAVQSLVKYPDFYQCAVASAGIYDLNMLDEEGSYADSYASRLVLREFVGTDEKQLKAHSPVYNAKNIKAPILLIHGVKDEIAPIEHAEALKEALDKSQKEFEWLVFDQEEHGLRSDEKRVKYYKRVAKFLNTHIK
ncbi:alpha/beta hydrolase family protein [Pleionea sediminis]|uniref:alpha/beta hydrolase family protein n=1 Tax=Pleionea sediminis TaxID=2569479 RepID=UPI001185CA22|nr:alpha/beta fold hydrolase [Pleionea sediminis]